MVPPAGDAYRCRDGEEDQGSGQKHQVRENKTFEWERVKERAPSWEAEFCGGKINNLERTE